MTSPGEPAAPREQFVRSGPARLYVRDIGHGPPIIIVHGGPDFDHEYLIPDMDRLAESFRVVYYDQRGRGRSFSGQDPEDVTILSEIDDLDQVREHFRFGDIAVAGHSWGGLIAMEYAIRWPARVSRLILMNTAPVSHAGNLEVRRELQRRRSPEQSARIAALVSDPEYRAGDVYADIEYYRIHFGAALRNPAHLERVIQRLRSAFTKDSIVAARAIEQRLYQQTWESQDYDLIPQLKRLRIPTLIIHGEDDFIPVKVVRQIADAIAGSRLVTLAGCGHFSFLEQPVRVLESIAAFFAAT